MNKISTLNSSANGSAMIFMDEKDDGLLVHWSHGRMSWYRSDTGNYINLDNYSYWMPI